MVRGGVNEDHSRQNNMQLVVSQGSSMPLSCAVSLQIQI